MVENSEHSETEDKESIVEVLEKIEREAEGDELKVVDINSSFGSRGYGPIMMVPALIAASPVGMIPFLPTTFGVILFLISSQLIFGKESPWLPGFLRNYGVDRQRFNESVDKIEPWVAKFERLLTSRWTFFFNSVGRKALGVVCVILSLTMPPLEWIPGAASIPALGIALTGASMVMRDGIVASIAIILSFSGIAAVYLYFF